MTNINMNWMHYYY